MGPARMRESLTTTPGIREQPRPIPVIRHAAHSITSSARASTKAGPKVAILSWNLAAGPRSRVQVRVPG
jgi:hypothetical protein